jgi:2-methylcitrate dehydratase PrpD
MTILSELGEFLSTRNFEKISKQDKESVRIHILDTVCASIVGAKTPDGIEALTFQKKQLQLNALTKTPLDDVLTRCAITRLSEIDDIHLPSGTTPGSIIVPTAIVLSAHLGITDPNIFASSIVAGYEAMTRLGEAIDGQSLIYKGIWTTYFTSPFGTAAVTAHLLGLDAHQTAHAQAIALTLIAGRIGKPGSEKTSRWVMVGNAARSGCFAALNAATGFTGDLELLDGDWMETAHGVPTDKNQFLKNKSGPCVVSEISTKPYCSAKQMIGGITGFQEILARGINPDEINTVVVSVPETYAGMINHGVIAGNRLSSATSAPYQIAIAAYNPEGLFDVARSKYILNENVTGLMAKVSVKIDGELKKYLPNNWPARVEVKAGNRTERITVIDAPGDPACAFNLTQTQEKFYEFANDLIGQNNSNVWIQLASNAAFNKNALIELQQKFLAIGN